jgi:electron transfer flavoprotein beta subunit
VVTVKEGINLPRYPSLPGRLRAKRAEITVLRPHWQADGLRKQRLRLPERSAHHAEILGHGSAAVPELVRVLGELGVLSSRPRAPAGSNGNGAAG